MNEIALPALDLVTAANRLHSGELSPADLLETHLEHIANLNPELNAFITIDREGARSQAKLLSSLGKEERRNMPLYGIPVSFKDNIPVSGLPATQGSKAFIDYIPDADNPVVAKVRQAGAIIVGKTNMHECASGGTSDNPTFGRVHNPWDRSRSAAGSSGGCAVAVSTGMSMVSFGTDAGGSIRYPASVTGIVGVRPTLGSLSTEGMLTYSTDTIGPLTRTVADARSVLAALDLTPAGSAPQPVRGLRIATVDPISWENTVEDVETALREALVALVAHEMVPSEVRLDNLDQLVPSIDVILAVEGASQHRARLRERPGDYSADIRQLLLAGELISGVDYLQAQRYRRALRVSVLRLLEEVDLLIMPSQPFTALPFGQETLTIRGKSGLSRPGLMLRCTSLASLAGLPAVNVPVGLDRLGLPIGVQLVGRPREESRLLDVAQVLETRMSPPLAMTAPEVTTP